MLHSVQICTFAGKHFFSEHVDASARGSALQRKQLRLTEWIQSDG